MAFPQNQITTHCIALLRRVVVPVHDASMCHISSSLPLALIKQLARSCINVQLPVTRASSDSVPITVNRNRGTATAKVIAACRSSTEVITIGIQVAATSVLVSDRRLASDLCVSD
jgi:hypothetical protein